MDISLASKNLYQLCCGEFSAIHTSCWPKLAPTMSKLSSFLVHSKAARFTLSPKTTLGEAGKNAVGEKKCQETLFEHIDGELRHPLGPQGSRPQGGSMLVLHHHGALEAEHVLFLPQDQPQAQVVVAHPWLQLCLPHRHRIRLHPFCRFPRCFQPRARSGSSKQLSTCDRAWMAAGSRVLYSLLLIAIISTFLAGRIMYIYIKHQNVRRWVVDDGVQMWPSHAQPTPGSGEPGEKGAAVGAPGAFAMCMARTFPKYQHFSKKFMSIPTN